MEEIQTKETIEERALYLDILIWEQHYTLKQKNKNPFISDLDLYNKMSKARYSKFKERLRGNTNDYS